MNVVDSSAWLEYFSDGPDAGEFERPIQDLDSLIVPSITIHEVFKRVRVLQDQDAALQAIAFLKRGTVVDLDADLAVAAADLSAESRLPMADSVILATAVKFDATLWTQDADVEGLPGVEYRPS